MKSHIESPEKIRFWDDLKSWKKAGIKDGPMPQEFRIHEKFINDKWVKISKKEWDDIFMSGPEYSRKKRSEQGKFVYYKKNMSLPVLPNEWAWQRILREEKEETGSDPKLSTDLNKQIRSFKGQIGIFNKNPTEKNLLNLQNRDALLSRDIQDYLENELPEEPEESGSNNVQPDNLPSMTPEQQALADRAKAVGLPETATEAEISAAEAAKNAPPTPPEPPPTPENNNPPAPDQKSRKNDGIGQYFGMDDED